MRNVVITGANRGIGLALTKEFLGQGDTVHACCRAPEAATELRALEGAAAGRLVIHRLDVTDDRQVEELGAYFDAQALDLLINNAGVYGDDGQLESLDFGEIERVFRINALAPLRIGKRLLGSLERGSSPKIVNITSKMGSVAENTSGNHYAYRASKAALNMLTKSLAIDLAQKKIIAVVMHPGWVRTDMGGSDAPLLPEESARGIRMVLERLAPEESGSFFQFDGTTIPW